MNNNVRKNVKLLVVLTEYGLRTLSQLLMKETHEKHEKVHWLL